MSDRQLSSECFDFDDLMHHEEELKEMAEELAGLGYKDAADETLALLMKCRQLRTWYDTIHARLWPVWKAVDKHHSGKGDYIAEAIAKYRGEPKEGT